MECLKCGYIGEIGACRGQHIPGGAACVLRQKVKIEQERDVWEEVAGELYDIAQAHFSMDEYYSRAEARLAERALAVRKNRGLV